MTKELSQKVENVDVVRHEEGKIHVLGTNKKKRYHIIHDASTGEIISEEISDRWSPRCFEIGLILGSTIIGAPIGIPFMLYGFLSKKSRRQIREGSEYIELAKKYQEANMNDLREKVKDIEIHQGTKEEVSQRLEKELEYVDTGKPDKFLKERDTFWLRVKAHCLGANAIVHYQPGSSVGTPVKYKN